MKELVIDRSKWINGSLAKESELLSRDGMMCCLGFESIRCGALEEDIYQKASPARIPRDVLRCNHFYT